MTQEELVQAAKEAMEKIDDDQAMKIAQQSVEAGIPYGEMLSRGFGNGIRVLGDLFGRGEVFLPELIVASEIMQNVAAYYEEQDTSIAVKKPGKIVISTVEGDVHDIGKGIVAAMLRSQGYEVIDLGRDRPAEEIIETAVKEEADFIGTSALLTTTLPEQKKIEGLLKKHDLKGKIRTIVGGAPCTQRWADRIQADIYAEDSAAAIRKIAAAMEG